MAGDSNYASVSLGSITVAGQTPTLYIAQADSGNITGTGFSTVPEIVWAVGDTAEVNGGGFYSAPEILGGATVRGSSFSSALSTTYATDNLAYVTGGVFTSVPAISVLTDACVSVTGRGFSTSAEILGGAAVEGDTFRTLLAVTTAIPASAKVIGTSFTTTPTIEAIAISSAIVIGGSFVSGLSYSKIVGRGFSSSPIIKTAFTAEYAEAVVMNVLTGTVSRYQNYPFMALGKIGSSYYGFGTDGLYELTGESDLENDVLGTIRTNDEDLDAFNSRNIPYIYLNGEDDYSVTAVVDEVAQPTFTSGFGGRRVRLARGSKGRYWYFEIGGIKHLQGLEYTPDRLTRKVK